ncbi:MAG: low molecular weight protein arginine phosphatase [Bacillota bacterium]
MKVLFVCTGNTCRSCMARVIAERELARAGLGGVEVLSAGTFAVSGRPASENALAVMEEMGMDLKGHRSSALDKKLIEESRLVLTMTARHRQTILSICPGAAAKVFTLAEYAGAAGDVPDPFGGGPDIYRRVADQMEGMIRLAVDRLAKEKNTGDSRS